MSWTPPEVGLSCGGGGGMYEGCGGRTGGIRGGRLRGGM